MIAIKYRSEDMLITGDISLDEQLTVSGMVPPVESFHYIVTESTYGGRLHSDRQTEVNRLLSKVKEVVGRGGKMLIPALCAGTLAGTAVDSASGHEEGRTAPDGGFGPDGLVREVCGSYTRFSVELPRFARKLSEQHGNPFFGVSDSVQPVTKGTSQRDEILAGPPCVIVSSSGMLTGGPSQYYARRLALDPANCIALTGYQDEESPGRRPPGDGVGRQPYDDVPGGCGGGGM